MRRRMIRSVACSVPLLFVALSAVPPADAQTSVQTLEKKADKAEKKAEKAEKKAEKAEKKTERAEKKADKAAKKADSKHDAAAKSGDTTEVRPGGCPEGPPCPGAGKSGKKPGAGGY